MDALGTPVIIQTRGPEIMRVLPKVNPEINEEWVSDKGRHAFEGLRFQRLNTPLKRGVDGKYEELTWEQTMAVLVKAIKGVKGDEIEGRIGPHTDVESIVAIRDLLHRLGCERLRYGARELPHDFRAQYLLGSSIRGLDFADTLLIVGYNPRTICPVLNARIRKSVTDLGLKVAVIGPGEEFFYNYVHLGNSTKTLLEIAGKTHPYCKVLESAKMPMIIVSSDILRRKDGQAIAHNLHKICAEYKVIKPEIHWNGYNVMLKTAAEAGAYDIGIGSNLTEEEKKKKCKLFYLLGVDEGLNDIPDDAFVIYQVFLIRAHYRDSREMQVLRGQILYCRERLIRRSWAAMSIQREELNLHEEL